jgi:hypothetical protein
MPTLAVFLGIACALRVTSGVVLTKPFRIASPVCVGGNLPANTVCVHGAVAESRVTIRDFGATTKTVTIRACTDQQSDEAIMRAGTLMVTVFSCEGNLHHFLCDTLFPVYTAIQATRDALYEMYITHEQCSLHPPGVFPDTNSDCHGDYYVPLLSLFCPSVDAKFRSNCLRAGLPRACFRTGIITAGGHFTSHDFPALLATANHSCSEKASFPGHKTVIVVNRTTTRQIVNHYELLSRLQEAGFRARLVAFEHMKTSEQLMTVACRARALVGIHGAGLQWIGFAPPHVPLLELSHREWGCYYTHRVGSRAAMCMPNQTRVSYNNTRSAKDSDVRVAADDVVWALSRLLAVA